MGAYDDLHVQCDLMIRSGNDGGVSKLLAGLNALKLPRQWRLPFASLCRRTSHIQLGLKLLAPIIKPLDSRRITLATMPEKAEYAALLQRCGAVEEALRLLNTLDVRVTPMVYLYSAFCHFNQWEYGKALPHLRAYESQATDPYQHLIARVNLGAALVLTNDLDTAKDLLEETRAQASAQKFRRLEANCHELLAQVHIAKGSLKTARVCLERNSELLDSTKSVDRLLAKKCLALVDAYETNSVKPLLDLRREAQEWPHPETVREIDLFSLTIRFDERVFDRLYFGTPFPAYRARIERVVGRKPDNSVFFIGDPSKTLFDTRDGSIDGQEGLPSGSLPHRLIKALSRDLYRPLRLGGCFGALFPDEAFDPFSSPTRLHQLLRRVRRWSEEKNLDFEIAEIDQTYFLKLGSEINLAIGLDSTPQTKNELYLNRLQTVFSGEQEFSAKDASLRLGLSPPALKRFIRWGLESGHLERFGASTATRYTLKRDAA